MPCAAACISSIVTLTVIACAGEYALRNAAFSTSTGQGKAAKRWATLNWHPQNQLGFRDEPLQVDSTKQQILFLGDSFTAGHGVRFEETTSYLMKHFMRDKYQYFNLGRNGAAPRQELQTLMEVINAYHPTVYAVVHQYFGNDVQDFIAMPQIDQNILPKPLTERSELAGLINSLLFARRFGAIYVSKLLGAYQDPAVMEQHLSEIHTLHDRIRSVGGRVIFLIFPFLDSKKSLISSNYYVSTLKNDFLNSTCRPGDVVIDASIIAADISVKKRVVNMLDPHPSPLFHGIIASILQSLLQDPNTNHPAVTRCTRM